MVITDPSTQNSEGT